MIVTPLRLCVAPAEFARDAAVGIGHSLREFSDSISPFPVLFDHQTQGKLGAVVGAVNQKQLQQMHLTSQHIQGLTCYSLSFLAFAFSSSFGVPF
jgi:hypothetical protein